MVEERRRNLHVRKIAKAAIATLKQPRGIFIDLGSNLGQGFQYFRRYFPARHFDFVLVEPNPYCASYLRTRVLPYTSATLIEAAASSHDGKTLFYGIGHDQTSEGASILREHNAIYRESDPNTAITVKCFSFSDFLRAQAEHYDTIIVKMDIEGAEYDVLTSLMRNDACRFITHLFVEFHARYMKEPDRQRFLDIERNILDNIPIPYTKWH